MAEPSAGGPRTLFVDSALEAARVALVATWRCFEHRYTLKS